MGACYHSVGVWGAPRAVWEVLERKEGGWCKVAQQKKFLGLKRGGESVVNGHRSGFVWCGQEMGGGLSGCAGKERCAFCTPVERGVKAKVLVVRDSRRRELGGATPQGV